MLKYIAPLLLLAGIAVYFALRPVDALPPPSPKTAPAAGETGGGEAPAAVKPTKRAPTPSRWGTKPGPRTAPTTAKPRPPVVQNALDRARPSPSGAAPAKLNFAGAPEAAGVEKRPWGRAKTETGMAAYRAVHVKEGLRRYYANLPKGKMPAKVRLDDLLPGDLIDQMNLPPDCRVVEIGSYPATSPKGLEEVLRNTPDDVQGTFGITCRHEGETFREYVQTTPK